MILTPHPNNSTDTSLLTWLRAYVSVQNIRNARSYCESLASTNVWQCFYKRSDCETFLEVHGKIDNFNKIIN